jgi:hypothetical protein
VLIKTQAHSESEELGEKWSIVPKEEDRGHPEDEQQSLHTPEAKNQK